MVPNPSSTTTTTSTSAQSKRQHSQDELRSLSDSQLGLQLAILLPERMCESPMAVSEEEKPSCPPQMHAQGQRHERMTLRQSEGPPGAIPDLDLDAAQEVDEASSDGAALPEAEVSGGGSDNGGDGDYDAVMRLNRVASRSCRSRGGGGGSSCELAGANATWRCVAPRDLLFA